MEPSGGATYVGGLRVLTQTQDVDTSRRLVLVQTNDKSATHQKWAELNDEHKSEPTSNSSYSRQTDWRVNLGHNLLNCLSNVAPI